MITVQPGDMVVVGEDGRGCHGPDDGPLAGTVGAPFGALAKSRVRAEPQASRPGSSNVLETAPEPASLVQRMSRLAGRWLGREGSNLRMSVPKTDALPLGDAPTGAVFSG